MKNILKKTLSSLLVAAIILTAAPLNGFVGLDLPEWLDFSRLGNLVASAAEYKSGIYTYVINNNDEITITKVEKSISGVVTVPDKLDRCTVIAIDDSAFENCTLLTELNIPESVTKLGAEIFYGCTSLKSLYIPKSVVATGYYNGMYPKAGGELNMKRKVMKLHGATGYRFRHRKQK